MSRTLLSGLIGLAAAITGLVWLAMKANRRPADDHVSGSELARINNDYRDNP
jgi:hypothetical protein